MSRPRRDPRGERATKTITAAGRIRLDVALRAARAAASGRPRRDPWREWAASLVDETHRKRYDRSQRQMSREEAARFSTVRDTIEATAISPGQPALRVIEKPAFLVFAVVEAAGGRLSRFDRQVLGAARLLADAGDGGGAVVAVIAAGATAGDAARGDDHETGLGAAGADRVLVLEGGASPSGRSAAMLSAVEGLSPRHVVFAEDGDGADLARRLSVCLGEALFPAVEHLTARQAVRALRHAKAEIGLAPPRLMTIGEDRAKPYEAIPCEARRLDLGPFAGAGGTAARGDDSAILSVEIIPGDPARLSLSETDFVVSAGNGVSDFTAFRALAAKLRATPGASRVVCDAGLMPRAAQVGASGTVLSADCYLALGISGAPQHLQGIVGCEHVIAVNTDLHAAMIERAGLAIVADAQRVMPALLKLLGEAGA
ncbi:electron transfer flavoprotein subunit alpha/FixB family protein [Jiella sonneratiae]|uniref:Electron transfer flavoprotein subunit alpha/FixB family protein n=1 Tax=Jiella sonneratiae TaxID=2816856 RepID=A0ABS3JA81_9HYPH|nr:electron transfer flavoprotein subunit alpha/FixB family protein [Jiella sonneratiae]MBO0905828.1 electron transfer flavoprotein subunit alpha/FixB family protein [Jiella sonneratiae]